MTRRARSTRSACETPGVATPVNALTDDTGPAGHAWLCRAHGIAGESTASPCCHSAIAVDRRASDRLAWYALRMQQKPPQVRAGIRATIANATWGLIVLSGHACASKRWWHWLEAIDDTELRVDVTQNIRAVPSR